jgi:head-tail adaptor
MPSATERKWKITFLRAATSTDDYGQVVEDWANPTVLATVRAKVRFGTAQEKREAAKEGGTQSATFECVRSSALDSITLKDRIGFDGSQWDLSERAALDRADIRFTGTRML